MVLERGAVPSAQQHDDANAVLAAMPRGPAPYAAVFVVALVFAAIVTHHLRRSTRGRLVRV